MENINKIDATKLTFGDKEYRELWEKGIASFDNMKTQGLIDPLDRPIFMMAWSLACLHFDKKLQDRLTRLS